MILFSFFLDLFGLRRQEAQTPTPPRPLPVMLEPPEDSQHSEEYQRFMYDMQVLRSRARAAGITGDEQ